MIRLVSAGSEMSEAIFAAKEINRMVGGIDMLDAQEGFGPLEERKTRSFGDIAVIYRTHRQGTSGALPKAGGDSLHCGRAGGISPGGFGPRKPLLF